MTAITSVEIENFRCFRKLRVDGLAQVNLIVGANNAGKTALLEAIEAVVSRDSPFTLYRATFDRGEFRWRRGAEDDLVELDLRHWFHGHELAAGATFSILATGDVVRARSWSLETVSEAPRSPPFIPGGLRLVIRPQGLVEGSDAKLMLPLTADGLLGAGKPSAFVDFGMQLKPPVGFVSTDRPALRKLARLWKDVVLRPGEERANAALRLIEPQIDRIAILEADGVVAEVLLRGASGPIPLGTLGEGVARVLTLALHLALNPGGFLLIDEIENGLHWSVVPKIWRFLVEAAVANQTQIFAATHSKDWLDGLAELHRIDPPLAAHVAVHRVEAGRETSIRFDAGRINEYFEMELEAR